MFQNRRRVFLFICVIVFVQALYYVVTLQINRTSPILSNSPSLTSLIYNRSSDNSPATVEQSQSTTLVPPIVVTNTTLPQTTTNLTGTNGTWPTTITSTSTTSRTTSTSVSTTTTASASKTTTVFINTTITTSTSTTTVTTLPTTTVAPFANASFYSSFNLTLPDAAHYNSLSPCNFSISNNNTVIYKVLINQTLNTYQSMESNHAIDLYPGGHSMPTTCRAEQRLALIICYRNREQHLKMFLDNIHPFLKRQFLDYTIFLVNQHGTDQFNRAALFNVGYLEAMKLYPFDCFIFHDVDLLPEDLRNVYRCGDQPRHMSVAVDKFNYKLLYSTLFGGVTAFRLSDFVGTNGYPTVYWGWGGEDDDMYLRVVKKLKKSITRYPIEIARYKMIRTHDHTSGKANPNRHTILYSKYDYSLDGISTTNYTLHQLTFYKLFTLINVTLQEEPFEKIRKRLNIKKKK